ncbi:MAG TPA: NAD-dependent succinate-semialdehyde dehydrogenase [Myxococcota bacterium]
MSLTENTKKARALAAATPHGLLIGGAWRDARKTFSLQQPATTTPIADIADASAADGVAALDAAVAAQKSWASSSPNTRATLLQQAFDRLTAQADDFALLMSLESGKPLSEARGEVAYAAAFLRFFAGEALRHHGRTSSSSDGRSRHVVTRRPVGPCLLITPWNFPLAMLTRKVAPAIAAGCTVIIKPAELTPLTTLRFAQLLVDVGVPAGVINVLTTADAQTLSSTLLADGRLRKVSFTGSTSVGRTLLAQGAQTIIRSSMELGGNAPFIVCEDADVDAAVAGAMIAKFRNAGQACTAANRLYVHRRLLARFSEAFIDKAKALVVGDGLDDDTQLGTLINDRGVDKVTAAIDIATQHGARIALGGTRGTGAGHFFAPTVLVDVAVDNPVLQDEIFGPVAPIVAFDDDDEAIAAANDTIHGLAAYVFTRDLGRAQRYADGVDSGMLGINTGLVSDAAAPFGGVKQSGLGREGGSEGIEEYQSVHYANVVG